MIKNYTILDRILTQVDNGLRTVWGLYPNTHANPADAIKQQPLTDAQKKHSAALLRIDHTGEVCAQALYRGQIVAAQKNSTKKLLEHACEDETHHLAWTKQRLTELNGRTSLLNCFWYIHSFAIGLTAGLCNDEYSLGFINETEQQVGRHLQSHINELPEPDEKSRAILRQMYLEELEHADNATAAGGKVLPQAVKKLMVFNAKIMTTLTYWI